MKARFNVETLERIANDMKAGKYGNIEKIGIGDEAQPGLRAMVFKSGKINFHAGYQMKRGGTRSYIVVGNHPETTIEEARHLARTIRGLAGQGVDVQEGLHARLIKELKRDGLKWRPK